MRNGLSKSLIKRILGDIKYTIPDLESLYPPRNLPDGAIVSRFAPSPTGFMHIGNLYSMLIDKKLAQQSDGIFYLRIEDTDTKREVDGAIDLIFYTSTSFGLNPNEWFDKGEFGPYKQSMRKDIYFSVVSELLEKGLAYPCFLSSDEMNEIRKSQTASGMPTGIYGEFAKYRNAEEQEIIQKLDSGLNPSIRLYSTGNKNNKIFVKDLVRGSIGFPENDEDIVLIKSNDGLPTYHFAHLIDDHFMRTSHVVRGEEWLPSLPLHIQLFKMMNWTAPSYIHTSTLDTIDAETGKQRKLSKRKDPMANVSHLIEQGFPNDAVLEYLFNIVNSGYEDEKIKGKIKDIWESEIKIKKIPTSGALFDMKKLEWWCKEFIATLSVDDLASRVSEWAIAYGNDFNKEQVSNASYLKNILSIERDDPKRVRKDFITWKQTLEEIDYFFKDDFKVENINKDVLSKWLGSFDIKDSKDLWWDKITKVASLLGIKNGDAASSLRVAITGRINTPDLYSIIKVMGENKVKERIKRIIL